MHLLFCSFCLFVFVFKFSAGLSNRIFQTCSRIPFGVFIKLLVIYEGATPNNNLLFCLSVSVLKMAKCKKHLFLWTSSLTRIIIQDGWLQSCHKELYRRPEEERPRASTDRLSIYRENSNFHQSQIIRRYL